MRDVQKIWDIWRSGIYVGDSRPSTRVTVEPKFHLDATGPVVGQWHRGPARWFQRADLTQQEEIEIPGVLTVSSNRSVEADAGTCDITVRNVTPPVFGDPEMPPGQFADLGHYTPERGDSQESAARWGHAPNSWTGILVPNALLRTYQGFGGQDKNLHDALADGDIVLNGVWLVDDVTINTDGTLALKCRDMMKLLIDQQLVPPLVPVELYPLKYNRYRIEPYSIPAAPPPGDGSACPSTVYPPNDGAWHSSSDLTYGGYNSGATGHPPADAYDISFEPGPIYPGKLAHQRSYWLSEPKGGPRDSVWIDMDIPGNVLPINEVYIHPWRGWMEGKGNHLVMISVWEGGQWALPSDAQGGVTPEGIPYVTTAVPGRKGPSGSPEDQNRNYLPRDYRTTRIRLTWTNLIWSDDYPHDGGGFRAGARKLMACFNPKRELYPPIVFAGVSIPANDEDRSGYWQVRANGEVFAFGDARVYPQNNPGQHLFWVTGMAVHPHGRGYWTIDNTGFVIAAGEANYFGDPAADGRDDYLDIAPTPSGNGYWILRRDGVVQAYGDAGTYGWAPYNGIMHMGGQAWAQAIESHPDTQGYWVLWTDGHVQAFNLPHYGDADAVGFAPLEWVTTIKRNSTGKGYRILSGTGRVQCKGDATFHGNAGALGALTDAWPWHLFWDLLISSESDHGYLIQQANGGLFGAGDFHQFGSIGTGKGELRYDGNYKDYSDIVKELLLWAGFYLYKNPQPSGAMPDVYGNIESTGAYSTNDPLPAEMFDKRPVLDAIRDIKAIVGYAFYIDAEGGARWEAPNWWQMGNFLIDGTPFAYMPEVDEVVQLTSHSVVRSAAAARSEIIISTQYPYATVNGQKVPDGIVKTRIVSVTEPDLKGIIMPAMWSNGQFLKPEEQRTMAELIDLQIWFARRTASVQCVANPLIDVNDQIRIIERQTGEVYIHYIKSISMTHDLHSGQFTMSLTTHWLGGTPFGERRLFRAAVANPQGDGYWQIATNGDVYAYGAAQLHARHEPDTHLSWPIAMRTTASGDGYWTMDQNGKILTYGDAEHFGDLNRGTKDAVDLAITPTGRGYWILLLNGEVHTFGDAVWYGNTTPTGDVTVGVSNQARSIESHPVTMGYWILHADGTVTGFHLPAYGNANRTGFRPSEYVTRLRRTTAGNGYWIVSGSGKVQNFNAPSHGNAVPYADDQWVLGSVWDFVTDPAGGYGVQHADGTFEMLGFTHQGVARVGAYHLEWALVTEDTYRSLKAPTSVFPLSDATIKFLKGTASPSATNAVANNFNSPNSLALEGTVT